MATLPKNPDGYQLEHLVAAHFVSRGCFDDTKVTERDFTEVSDIDLAWTEDQEPSPRANPVEVNSGGWSRGGAKLTSHG